MNPNPWHCLPETPPFVLPEEKARVEAINNKMRETAHEHLLNLDLIPMPFVGRPDAPVVLLGNIAGAGEEQFEDYKRRPAYAERLRKNLIHENTELQFLPLSPDSIPSHREWWSHRLTHLLDSFRNEVNADAEAILARSILAIEFFPYRSRSNRYAHGSLSLPSQQYCWLLVYEAMKNEAVIVVRYGKARWFSAVRGLESYQHLLLLKGNQQTHLSPTGFEDSNGYKKVVDKIRAC